MGDSVRRSQRPEEQIERPDFASTQFGEQIVAARDPGFHIEPHHGFSPRTSTKTTTNAGSVGTSGGLLKLSTGTNADDKVTLTSNQCGEYGSGKEAEAKIALALSGRASGDAVIRWGYFNDDNGLFFQDSADGIEYYIRDGGTDKRLRDETTIDPSSLLVDGSADAKIEDFDLDDLHIWGFLFAWYAAGGEVAGLLEQPREVSLRQRSPHEQVLFDYFPQYDDELSEATYMQVPNLPLRIELINDPAATTSPSSGLEVLVGGRQFSLVGSQKVSRTPFHETASVNVGTSRTPIFAIRPREKFDGTTTPSRENPVNLRVLESLYSTSGNVTITAEVGAEVDESYSLPSGLDKGQTAAETTYTSSGSLTESTGSDGSPAGIGALLRSGRGSGAPATGAARESDPLGNGQSLVFFAEADAADTDIDLFVPWTESQEG